MGCWPLGCGLHFCNPQAEAWVVGGGGMGYIFVTRDEECGSVVVGRWMCGLHFCNPQMMEFCGVCGGCVGYIFVTREYMRAVFGGGDKVFCVFNVLREVWVSMAFRYLSGRVFFVELDVYCD